MLIDWNYLYNFFGIADFIYFISSPTIQEALFPIKMVCIFFTLFFFCLVMYFYVNSSFIRYKFLQDFTEYMSRNSYGLRKVTKTWNKIKKRIDSGGPAELRLAIIEADDFLYQVLQDAGFEGETFDELAEKAAKKTPSNVEEMLEAHRARNSIVYDPDYQLSMDQAKRILSIYESAIKNISSH